MGAVPKPSASKEPRFLWESEVDGSAWSRALRAPLRIIGVGVSVHRGIVTRKVRQPFKELFPEAGRVPGSGNPPTNLTWIFLDDAETPVGWIGRPPPKAPSVGDTVQLGVSPHSGVVIRSKAITER
jgi:hypothetical protein